MPVQHPTIPLLIDRFGPQNVAVEEFAGDTWAIVPKSLLAEVLQFLHDDRRCTYEQLTDIVGIDYQGYPKAMPARFAAVYPLLSLSRNQRINIKTYCHIEDMKIPSATGVYLGADWLEREAAEMFGFTFVGHPDPRRLLLMDLFAGKYPLRKDYPLRGMGERESFPIIDRNTA